MSNTVNVLHIHGGPCHTYELCLSTLNAHEVEFKSFFQIDVIRESSSLLHQVSEAIVAVRSGRLREIGLHAAHSCLR